MTPIPFREQNITYNPPEGMEDKCEALPAFRGEGQVISCWHLTLWERIKLLLTGRLWFSVIGNGQPPIWLGVDCPFIRKYPTARPDFCRKCAKILGSTSTNWRPRTILLEVRYDGARAVQILNASQAD